MILFSGLNAIKYVTISIEIACCAVCVRHEAEYVCVAIFWRILRATSGQRPMQEGTLNLENIPYSEYIHILNIIQQLVVDRPPGTGLYKFLRSAGLKSHTSHGNFCNAALHFCVFPLYKTLLLYHKECD